jgi:hypothetical protein
MPLKAYTKVSGGKNSAIKSLYSEFIPVT